MWVLVIGITFPFYNLLELHGQALLNQTNECVTIRRSKIIWLLFAKDLVLLVSSESGLQYALNGFAASCDIVEMK